MSNSKHNTDIDSDEYIEHYPKKKKLNSQNKCSICLEYIKKSKQMHFLPCCHYFHKPCVNIWLETHVTCPECRIPIYIQDIYQYEDYLEYYSAQKTNLDLVRRNMLTSDNAIAMRFVQNRKLFDIRTVEYTDISKIQSYIYMPELTFHDMYAEMFAEEDAQDAQDAADEDEAQEQYEQEQEYERELLYTEMQQNNVDEDEVDVNEDEDNVDEVEVDEDEVELEDEDEEQQVVIRNHVYDSGSVYSDEESIDMTEQTEYMEYVSESESESSINLRATIQYNTSATNSDSDEEEILFVPRTRIYNYVNRRRN